MVDFLIKRPIAVIMVFLALVIIGCVTFSTLPVSLLPDVAIPHLAVQVSAKDMSGRQLENSVVAPLRRSLMQVGGLEEIISETREGGAVINMTMDYGIDTDLAFIEVNEKIDAAMNSLPRSVSRPKAVKSSATDIPVLYVYLTPKEGTSFMDMADVTSAVVRRRLEQLPEVAMADVTGIPTRQLRIIPDYKLLQPLGITSTQLTSILSDNNTEPGSLTVRDGYYEYNIHISNPLRTPDDVRELRFLHNGRLHRLGDLCRVELTETPPEGYTTYNGQRAIGIAIIKHGAESMGAMEKAVEKALDELSATYPSIQFSKSRSQTQLLDFTISNLKQNLVLGLILVFFVCALFMRSGRLPFIIGITIVVAVIITFLLFKLFGVSINIISLAGLILAVGMMIDNSVIVAENITQFRMKGCSLAESCVKGTNEMITPMLSSSLTTVAVFVPLVFMSGIAGAIFADQAFAITAGLATSYAVGITLLPVLYFLFYHRREGKDTKAAQADEQKKTWLIRWYDRWMDIVFAHKTLSIAFVVVAALGAIPLFRMLSTERMPDVGSTETIVKVDWNENIDVNENLRRSRQLLDRLGTLPAESSIAAGMQDYLLNQSSISPEEAEIWLRVENPEQLALLHDSISSLISSSWPSAVFEFYPPDNIFEKVFSSSEPPLVARLQPRMADLPGIPETVDSVRRAVVEATGEAVREAPLRSRIDIGVRRDLLALYGVDYSEVEYVLRETFRGADATLLRAYNAYLPVSVTASDESLQGVITNTLLHGSPDKKTEVPLQAVVTTSRGKDFKVLHAGGDGEYIPFSFEIEPKKAPEIMTAVENVVEATPGLDVAFTGSIFSNSKMMKELVVILLVSLMMMYFILCAQFESFSQPLVVLLEIPVDITFALLSLLLCGQTLNLMSAIGIIVTCGIVVNDSILKIDAINEERALGTPLVEAIHIAGRRRLRPILMTSLTTVMAMLPVLFTSDMGSLLQRPLAISMIGSMVIGTLVSIFIIPLVYYLIYHRKS